MVAQHPHDPSHFTQGLLVTDGRLYESTGLYGSSAVQEVDRASGTRLRRYRLPRSDFGEGLTRVGDRLLQLTWREQRAWVYDLDLNPLGTVKYAGEGWGLTTLPPTADKPTPTLVMSDGSHRLQLLHHDSLQRLRQIEVRDGGRAVPRLNELEFVRGEILANVWHLDEVIAIDPESGAVRGRYDFAPLRRELRWPQGVPPETDLNGVAFDERSGRVLITGKRWPRLFEVELGGCVQAHGDK